MKNIILEKITAECGLHFSGLPHRIMITKRRPHNVENIQSFVLQIDDKPFAL
jgi:hypothetical protein